MAGCLPQPPRRILPLSLPLRLPMFRPQRAPLLLVVAIPSALARLYSGSLWGGIIAHQLTNLLPGMVMMFGLLGMMPAH